MTTASLTLADFLLARVYEDEHAARAMQGFQPFEFTLLTERFSPSRVLAECAAKRAIVEQCRRVVADDEGHAYYSDGWDGLSVAKATLRLLALPYAEHPDYREEWRR